MSNAWTLRLPVTRRQLLAVKLHNIFLRRRIFIEMVIGWFPALCSLSMDGLCLKTNFVSFYSRLDPTACVLESSF